MAPARPSALNPTTCFAVSLAKASSLDVYPLFDIDLPHEYTKRSDEIMGRGARPTDPPRRARRRSHESWGARVTDPPREAQ